MKKRESGRVGECGRGERGEGKDGKEMDWIGLSKRRVESRCRKQGRRRMAGGREQLHKGQGKVPQEID